MERNLSDIVCYRSRRPSIDEGQASNEEDSSHGPARTHSLDCTKLAELYDSPNARSDHGSSLHLGYSCIDRAAIIADAWNHLRRSIVYFRGQPVGTIAALDHSSNDALNHDQVLLQIPFHSDHSYFLCQ
ncbi:alkaline/neutral invertase CINV2-like [Hevea brasiliensis]|uniref:alkaline/neutral invertase CINV2-like n=1 Tax=Hevea brasiliensis TaxID=3981 RepID=UPI0025F92C68|nr:alkaline/neutral invertase CINV2-like [Hevea brasiliensis]